MKGHEDAPTADATHDSEGDGVDTLSPPSG